MSCKFKVNRKLGFDNLYILFKLRRSCFDICIVRERFYDYGLSFKALSDMFR